MTGPALTALRVLLAGLSAAVLALGTAAAAPAGRSAGAMRVGESQIDESAPDDSSPAEERPDGSSSLAQRLRDYVEGSLARYEALKCQSAVIRRQGWVPSYFLKDPAHDVVLESVPGKPAKVTVHLSYARRDCEHRLVISPAEQVELPGADRRVFAELLAALALISPEIGHARLVFWFGALRPDGRMIWKSRGAIGLSAVAARRLPAGSRTAEAVWPLLDENTTPASLWER